MLTFAVEIPKKLIDKNKPNNLQAMEKRIRQIMFEESSEFNDYTSSGYGCSPAFARRRDIEKFGDVLISRLAREGIIVDTASKCNKHIVSNNEVAVCHDASLENKEDCKYTHCCYKCNFFY